MSEIPKGIVGATIEEILICGCTGEQLERGETCGQANCPNRPNDDRALELLLAHPAFDRDAYAWVGSEHLGGGIFGASVYMGIEATDPYLWITEGEEGSEFLACIYIATANGEEAEAPFLSVECDAGELGKEAVRILTAARQIVSKP